MLTRLQFFFDPIEPRVPDLLHNYMYMSLVDIYLLYKCGRFFNILK